MAPDKLIHESKTNVSIMLDPLFYGESNDYVVYVKNKGGAKALISFQQGVSEPNGCRIEDIMRILIDKQMSFGYSKPKAIQSLIETLEYIKRGSK